MPSELKENGDFEFWIEPEPEAPAAELREALIDKANARFRDCYREHGVAVRDTVGRLITSATLSAGYTPGLHVVLYQAGRLTDEDWSDVVGRVALVATRREAAQAVAGRVLS